MKTTHYLAIIEPTATGFSGYFPDVPGYAAAGDTREEVENLMREGLAFHLEGLREQGQPVLAPTSSALLIEVTHERFLPETESAETQASV